MRRCRRCSCERLDIVRESLTRRGNNEYAMCWYRCAGCREISLSYRRLHEPAAPDTRGVPSSFRDPVLSR